MMFDIYDSNSHACIRPMISRVKIKICPFNFISTIFSLTIKKCPGQAYLKRQEKTFVSVDYPIDEPQEEVDDWAAGKDDPFEASDDQKRPLILEHHVLWSMSYSVPLIYFNGWKSGESYLWVLLRFSIRIRALECDAFV